MRKNYVSRSRGSTAVAAEADPIERAQRLTPVLKALADANRLAIVLELSNHERSVTELADIFGLPQALVSHHLKALREGGLVTVRAVGRSNIYSICCDALAEPIRLLAAIAATTSTP